MNQIEIARTKLLISLFVDSHRPDKRSMTREQLESEYFHKFDTPLFNSLVKELQDARLIKAYRDRATYRIQLRIDAYAAALSRILSAINANYLQVNWQGQRIVTDADGTNANELLGCVPDAWLLMTTAKDAPAQVPPIAPANSIARDVISIYGDVHGSAIGGHGGGKSDGWAKWGTIFGGVGVLIAIVAIGAGYYFWKYLP